MTLMLELPSELESELSAEASRLGVSLSDYVLNVLRLARADMNRPRSGAELVAYWQREGLVGSRGDIADSQEHARQLRKAAESRVRK